MQRTAFVIGTRGSPLAIAQAEIVCQQLMNRNHGIQVSLRKIVTEGDSRIVRAGAGKKLFTRAIDRLLKKGQIDIAVHSLKDIPVESEDDKSIAIAAYPRRESPVDVLISRDGCSVKDLPPNARIGTSSIRRAIQLKAVRQDFEILELHGNIGTRINKLKSLNLDAIVLARAGLKRLGYAMVGHNLSTRIMLPAPGQGCLAVSVRRSDRRANQIVKSIDHEETRIAVSAERAFSRFVGGGCNTPMAAYARIRANRIELNGLIQTSEGIARSQLTGSTLDPTGLGKSLAGILIANKGGG